jgi:hypothetical protein
MLIVKGKRTMKTLAKKYRITKCAHSLCPPEYVVTVRRGALGWFYVGSFPKRRFAEMFKRALQNEGLGL